MTSAVSVFKPGRRYWVLYAFLTVLIALSSLFWFLDPVPGWVRLLGAVIVVWWISILVGVARARIEVRESTVEVFSPAYRLTPSRGGAWLYAVLLLFVLADVAALFVGPWPHTVQRIGLGLRIAWLGAYLLNLLPHLERGKRSIRYSEIEKAPWEDWWQPYRTSVRKQAIFMEVAGDAQPFMFPPWLSAADRHEVAGRVTAHVKRFRATHSGETR